MRQREGVNTYTPAQGPNIAITNCQWASGVAVASDPNTAKSLVISGGTTLGPIAIDVGTPVNPMTIAFSNNFSSTYSLALKGQLKAGSSVKFTDCSFAVQSASNFGFSSLSFAGTDFVFSKNTVIVSVSQQVLKMPTCSGACTYTINDNLFNHTVTSNDNVIHVSSGTTLYHSITFVSRRIRFIVYGSPTSFISVGYRIAPASVVMKLPSASLPANWSLVTEHEARDVYGKSTYVIADNVFENVSTLWSITDPDGADFTIENNTASIAVTAIAPNYAYSGNYYRLKSAIRNNTLTSKGAYNTFFDLTLATLPAYSTVLIQSNTVTTAIANNANPRIVRLQDRTILNISALLEVSGNVLLSTAGYTTLRGGTVFSIYGGYTYTVSDEERIARSTPIMLYGNTLFTVPIDTHELTVSTVFFSNRSRMPVCSVV